MVGEVSFQYVFDFAERVILTQPNSGPRTCLIEGIIDGEEDEPFFPIVTSEKNLSGELGSSASIGIDETFNVMDEGYALTLIGESCMKCVWHLR